MKRSLIWCSLVLVLLVSAGWTQAQKAGETEKKITALEEQWLKALNANNPDLLAPLLDDKYVVTSPEGKVAGKTETLAEVKSFVKNSGENYDVKVTVFGDTAIAIGGSKGKQVDGSGKTIEFNERWTDTWVKMPNGKWQCVAEHASTVKM